MSPASVDWINGVRALVDGSLRRFFETERQRAAGFGREAQDLVRAVEDLTLRGGKRFRPAVLVASFRAVDGDRPLTDLAEACCALELLQSYLLIHDDWMDHDEERRGGPAVHADLRERHGDAHLGASLAVLAGDLASALSWKLMIQTPFRPLDRHREAVEVFLEMQTEVVYGQQLDLLATDRVDVMQRLKTGSYTVRGPVRLGAALAGASPAQRETLDRFAEPLGEAFQLRDDILGAFGDPRRTGKPAGNDLRCGKRTSLIQAAEALLAPSERGALTAVLGRTDASDEELAGALELLKAAGPKAEVEGRMQALVEQAREALADPPFLPDGAAKLRQLADLLSLRDR
ncbi:MAG: polyprenyl synthetase family protein [Sandaracinaceae bacterium]